MKFFGYTPGQVMKAIVAFITPGVIALGTAMQDASAGGSAIVQLEWVGIALAMLVTGGAVFGVKNAEVEPKPATV